MNKRPRARVGPPVTRRTFLRYAGWAAGSLAAGTGGVACGGGGEGSNSSGAPALEEGGTSTESPTSATVGGTVTFGSIWGVAPHLDASLLTTIDMISSVNSALHEPLLYLTQEAELAPAIAAQHVFDGPEKLRFRLRDDVVFHDGTRLTAADVKYTYERILAPDTASAFRSELSAIEAVNIPDDVTVVFDLARPDAALPFLTSLVPIIPEGSGESQQQSPIGAGPFAFQEWEEDVFLQCVRFEQYYRDGVPRIQGIRILPRPDSTAMRAGFQSGELDVVAGFAWTDVQALQAAVPDAVVMQRRDFGFIEVAMNTTRAPYDDVRVRQAVGLAVDRDQIAKAMFGPDAVAMNSYIPQESVYNPGVDPVRPDPESAANLFREAGLPEGSELEIVVPDLPQFRPTAPILQDGLRKAGIELGAPIISTADWVDKVFSKQDYEMTIQGTATPPDPAVLINPFYTSDGGSNITGYQSERLDQLLEDARGVVDDEQQRRALYREAHDVLVEDVPGFPITQPVISWAHQPWIDAFALRPNVLMDWLPVTNERTSE